MTIRCYWLCSDVEFSGKYRSPFCPQATSKLKRNMTVMNLSDNLMSLSKVCVKPAYQKYSHLEK